MTKKYLEMKTHLAVAGEDLREHLNPSRDAIDAMLAWANSLEAEARAARQIAETLKGKKFELVAEDSFVWIDGLDPATASILVDRGLCSEKEDDPDPTVEN